MNGPRFSRALFVSAFLLTSFATQAELRLPKLWSDHGVIQRDRPIHVWGWADPGTRVSVRLHDSHGDSDESTSAVTDALGHWSTYLPPHAADGGAYTLTVSEGQMGGQTLLVRDLLMGDVWLASGQSNMQLPLIGFPGSAVLQNSAEEIKAANHPEIRLLHEPNRYSEYPMPDQDATWQICTPQTASTFSAAAYFFGRNIHEDQKVPIGLIEADWGGTPAESWTSLEALSDPGLSGVFAARAADMDGQADAEAIKARNAREDATARAAGRKPEPHPWQPSPEPWQPASLYNGMIAPITPLTIRGVIWYQGEANTTLERAPLYHKLFSAMISDWRRHFAQGDFPFLFAQISSFRSTPAEDWGTVRDAQRRTLSLANTGMAITIDIGNPDNVHPADKQDVGHRLALAARALAYGESVAYTGPLFRQATATGDSMHVYFTGADGRLKARGGALTGFELAGADHHFVPATATISTDGETVTVTSPAVQAPAYVRYAWPNAPDANLTDSTGLPASTFTSEAVPTPPAH